MVNVFTREDLCRSYDTTGQQQKQKSGFCLLVCLFSSSFFCIQQYLVCQNHICALTSFDIIYTRLQYCTCDTTTRGGKKKTALELKSHTTGVGGRDRPLYVITHQGAKNLIKADFPDSFTSFSKFLALSSTAPA